MYESNCPSGFVSIFDLLYFPRDKEANRSRNKSTEVRLMARNGLCRRVVAKDQPVTLWLLRQEMTMSPNCHGYLSAPNTV